MEWTIYLFGSGAVYFIGIALILASMGMFLSGRQGKWIALATLMAIFGLLLVAASATPLPIWLYVLAGGLTVLWLAAERFSSGCLLRRRSLHRAVVVVIWVVAAVLELPYQWTPRLNAGGSPTFYIIGDSVSAGMGGEKETWPKMLARDHAVEVVDLSRMGATAASALKQAEGVPADGGLVLVEIGGNDLLGTTSAAAFERDLSKLLDCVCTPGRSVLMFELPLPPFCNEYGRIQRQLAAQHGVLLIPKRVFVSVLAGQGATLDSVHLDRAGHERMAEVVWSLIEPAYRK